MKLTIANLGLNIEAEISDGDEKVWAPEASATDENGIPTILTYRRKDGKPFMQIIFSNLVNGSYKNYKVINFAGDGAITSENIYEIPQGVSEQ